MTPRERDELVAAVTSARRHRDRDGTLRSHPAFHDLDEEGRMAAFDATVAQRLMEAATDPEGLSTTARAVLARIRR